MKTPQPLWAPVSVSDYHHREFFPLIISLERRLERVAICVCGLSTFHWTPLRQVWLRLPWIFPLDSWKTTVWSPMRLLFLGLNIPSSLCPSLYITCWTPSHLTGLPAGLAPLSQCLSCTWKPQTRCSIPDAASQAPSRGKQPRLLTY